MTKRHNLILNAIIPMIVALLVAYLFISAESNRLSQQSLLTLEKFLLESKQQELHNYTSIAVTSIDHIYSQAQIPDQQAQDLVAAILTETSYQGIDGYFFAYDESGVNIVHPKQPFRIGQNWWDIQDNDGVYLIRELIEQAKLGGGFVRYRWEKPSSESIGDKISYATFLDKWGWMLGTGVYLDDVQTQLNNLQTQMDNHIAKTTHIVLTVAILTILVVVALNMLIALRQKQKSDERVHELSNRIINLQEDERRRISHELHDGIVQLLVSIKYYFDFFSTSMRKESKDIPPQFHTAEKTLDQAINEIRRISHEMHPRILDELGLSEAIEALANEFSHRTGIEITLNKPSFRKVLPIDISTSLYRVAQESLNNIEKHSNATKVCISVYPAKGSLVLSIHDNGNSHSEQQPDGIGLRNLAERIDYHNGEFNYQFGKKGGRIDARIPLAKWKNVLSEAATEINTITIKQSES